MTSVYSGTSTTLHNGLVFNVTGATSGLEVEIYADGSTTPIGTATAAADGTAQITTTTALASGSHTFVAEQLYSYAATTVGNRSIAAGTLSSDASPSVSFTVTGGPTPTVSTAPSETSTAFTFAVTYTTTAGGRSWSLRWASRKSR